VVELGIDLTASSCLVYALPRCTPPLLERLDNEHLHLDHVRRAPHVHALDVDDRILELADLGPLIRGQQRDGLDAVRVVELEDVVQEAEQGGLVVLALEDPQEHEIGFRVGEDQAVMARDLPGSARRA
jgi:hypothetical protein